MADVIDRDGKAMSNFANEAKEKITSMVHTMNELVTKLESTKSKIDSVGNKKIDSMKAASEDFYSAVGPLMTMITEIGKKGEAYMKVRSEE